MKIPKFEPIQNIPEEKALRPEKAIKLIPFIDNQLPSPPVKKQLRYEYSFPTDERFDIDELKEFFNGSRVFPNERQLDQCTRIVDMSLFLDSHLDAINRHSGKETYKPHLLRLQKLRDILNTNDN